MFILILQSKGNASYQIQSYINSVLPIKSTKCISDLSMYSSYAILNYETHPIF